MHSVRRALAQRLPTSLAAPSSAAAHAAHAAQPAAAAYAVAPRRAIAHSTQLRDAQQQQQQSDASAEEADAALPEEVDSTAWRTQRSHERGNLRDPSTRGPQDYSHAELHGPVHRVKVKRQIIPASLTPEEQGSGVDFIPTLTRPFEWLRATQPALPPPLPWHPSARRTGVLGTKLGCMQLWDHHGVRLPITVVKVDCQVVGHRNRLSPKGLLGLQIGQGQRKFKNVTKALLVHCVKQGVWPPKRTVEFQVTPDAMLPAGWRFSVRHFVPGQFLDVTGTSIGKGFQGGMKQWGFGGLNASHGVSVSHRSIGATGSRQDPGRVFKMKKMPGRMGGVRTTKQNLKLFKIDIKNNLLFLVGTLPGNKGGSLMLRDAVKKPWNPTTPPPFPTHDTHVVKKGEEQLEEIVCAPAEADPFAFGVA